MAHVNSTRAAARTKPPKPYPSFPLYAHASGKWAKKVRGHLHYFGSWDDPQAALREYKAWAENDNGNRQAGNQRLTIKQLANEFLSYQDARLAAKEIAPRTFASMLRTGKLLVEHFGPNRSVCDLAPNDFTGLKTEIANRLNPVGVGNEVTRCKQFFHWAVNNDVIDSIKFGSGFCRPPKATIRRHRRDNPRDLFTASELRKLIRAADIHLSAMILLAVNCGFNNGDIADLRLKDVDLAGCWLSAPRKKTAVERECPLWPETTKALRKSLDDRPHPRTPAARHRFFVRPNGAAFDECTKDNVVTREFTALCRELGIDREGESFYTLRHNHSTWAQETGDIDACDVIMGHESNSIRLGYRHTFPKERLLEVSDHVHGCVFGKGVRRG